MIKFLDERKKGENCYISNINQTEIYEHVCVLKKRRDGKHIYCVNLDNGLKCDIFSKSVTFDTKEECLNETMRHINAQIKANKISLLDEIRYCHVNNSYLKKLKNKCLKQLENG